MEAQLSNRRTGAGATPTTTAKTRPMISTDTILMTNLATIVSVATQAIESLTSIRATATTATITVIITIITATIGTIAVGSGNEPAANIGHGGVSAIVQTNGSVGV